MTALEEVGRGREKNKRSRVAVEGGKRNGEKQPERMEKKKKTQMGITRVKYL